VDAEQTNISDEFSSNVPSADMSSKGDVPSNPTFKIYLEDGSPHARNTGADAIALPESSTCPETEASGYSHTSEKVGMLDTAAASLQSAAAVSDVEPRPSEESSPSTELHPDFLKENRVDNFAQAASESTPATEENSVTEMRTPPRSHLADIDVLNKSRSLWRELEPTDLTDPVEHTFCKRKRLNGIKITAASRRGRGHAQDAKYREDYVKIAVCNDWLLAAIADGTGSKRLARVGARAACEGAIGALSKAFEIQTRPEDRTTYLGVALINAISRALSSVVQQARLRDAEINDLASTLLVLALQTNTEQPLLGVAQVGDGGVAAQMSDGSYSLLGIPDRGQFAGESFFLTSSETINNWDQRVRVYEVPQSLGLIVMATDGVMDDFTPPIGAPLEYLFRALAPIQTQANPDTWLLDWLNYERRGSFDDRTIVVLYPEDLSRTVL
jgi:hypothetical protein